MAIVKRRRINDSFKVSDRAVVGGRSFSIVLWLSKLDSRDGVKCTSH